MLILPLLLAVSAEASAELTKMRQYQHQEGRSLKDYINDGYEIKAITNRDNVSDFNYFLQKGTDFVRCSEMTTGLAVFREVSCAVLIQPLPYQ
ncbi:hypothetical protein D3877_10180 [Azospirillum cavernae]|uniref:Uncharacterized protein n=1 Tax=Azospirillum cavernae TaxID=2320860 RepID=A0A418W4A3_9PROT|nr:hypothetical protein [Azospirillum cavernae]RJF84836.1 hypothetical protein D3877_10180 [Azospirillum cavernae]